MNTWKSNLEETKQHYIDWWNHRGIVLNMWEHFQQGVKPHADIPAPALAKSLEQKWFDPQWRADYLNWYVAHSSLKADILPVANTQLGPGSLAAILGGVFEGGEDTIWIHPDPNFKDDFRFDPNHPNYLLHKQLLRAVKEKAAGRYYVGMPDLMEGLDVIAAIKGTDKVLLDTVMQPDVLEAQVKYVNEVYFKVFDELYDIIREGDEMAFCYFSSWAPGKMTKLQCDISTMIGVEDFRRFVQPYLAEQARRIDYTLYHLDGVGALHHLPALLEIEELNAIQWTPGVGEPQGGSPKWYDLYRRILDGGKSVMACWVTLDELRPLLDNIGGNGVHLEMDFHSEAEVEQAMKIVDEYRDRPACKKVEAEVDSITLTPDDEVAAIINKVERESAAVPVQELTLSGDSALEHALSSRILVLDGAMGTMIQRRGLTESDFKGERFAAFDRELKGNNDLLSLTRPDVIEAIHRSYLEAGADIISTNTFNAQAISMADFGCEALCEEINLAACSIARRVADEFTAKTPSKPRFVVGSIGPTSKTCSIAAGSTQPGWKPFSFELLTEAYTHQAEALIEGGVDALLIETIFDLRNAEAALDAAVKAMKRKGRVLPIMLSFSVSTADGHNMLGQSVTDWIAALPNGLPIISVGLNCVPEPEQMTALIAKLGATDYRVSLYPNAGFPDSDGRYTVTPEQLRARVWPMLQSHALNIIGGCCGTTDLHIRALAEAVEPFAGLFLSPHNPGAVVETSVPTMPSQPHGAECECCHPKPAATCDAEGVYDAIVAGNADQCAAAVSEAVDGGAAPQDIVNGQMIRAMEEVGRRFEEGKAFVPQLLMAGRAMKAGLELLKPYMTGDASASKGKVLIGTVKGDLHDIGKNLVASMLEGCGFEVINIGIDVPAETFVDEIRKHRPNILCMSALLTTTMTYMKDVIDAVASAGLRSEVKIMVGGAPLSESFALEIGADGYSDNANTAVALARRLVNK